MEARVGFSDDEIEKFFASLGKLISFQICEGNAQIAHDIILHSFSGIEIPEYVFELLGHERRLISGVLDFEVFYQILLNGVYGLEHIEIWRNQFGVLVLVVASKDFDGF